MVSGLEVWDVAVRYGSVVAVEAVSFNLAPGEVMALLGPSGSGKSTLLRAIAGLEPLAAGSICWDGADLSGVPAHRRRFAMMFQDGQLFPHRNVAGNVGYALNRLDSRGRSAKVEELLELVGLSGYGPRAITSLSGGEAQRVALARSLAAGPRLLLLDEPLSALDRGLRHHLLGVLTEVLANTGTTALYVTHDQDEAFAIADRVAILATGRLLQVAEPEKLWRQPADAQVAEFLGYGPFLDPVNSGELGWSVPPGQVVAVGPDGLKLAERGLEVPVESVRSLRGGSEYTVRLPGGYLGRVRSTTMNAHRQRPETIRVRLDGQACVMLPAS